VKSVRTGDAPIAGPPETAPRTLRTGEEEMAKLERITTALEGADSEAIAAALAPDVVCHTRHPRRSPFYGRDAARRRRADSGRRCRRRSRPAPRDGARHPLPQPDADQDDLRQGERRADPQADRRHPGAAWIDVLEFDGEGLVADQRVWLRPWPVTTVLRDRAMAGGLSILGPDVWTLPAHPIPLA
jgi:hypothetical protein